LDHHVDRPARLGPRVLISGIWYETVAKALFEYYKLGAASLLIRGYDPRPDAIQYGEELIPRIRELVAAYDAERGPL
jgi:alkanesulfonate monooxygenase SsuD/methylene tetrahydromethanopterin reductase-like flavin-dependent oxidoreductase (luciferase family)